MKWILVLWASNFLRYAVILFSCFATTSVCWYFLFQTRPDFAAVLIERGRPPSMLGFDVRECAGIYLDIGTNVGVQIRKLYDPDLFPGALVLPVFKKYFGSLDRKKICAIGIEPNVLHTKYLKRLEKNFRCRGYNVRILTETAAATVDKNLTFYKDVKSNKKFNEWGASLLNWQHINASAATKGAAYSVHGVDFAHFLHDEIFLKSIDSREASKVPIVMKLDIEGAEFGVVPRLITTGVLCLLDVAFIEWHARMLPIPGKWERDRNITMEFLKRSPRCRVRLLNLDDETYGVAAKNITLPPCLGD